MNKKERKEYEERIERRIQKRREMFKKTIIAVCICLAVGIALLYVALQYRNTSNRFNNINNENYTVIYPTQIIIEEYCIRIYDVDTNETYKIECGADLNDVYVNATENETIFQYYKNKGKFTSYEYIGIY